MGSLKYDTHIICSDHRGVNCDSDNYCDHCKDWSLEEIEMINWRIRREKDRLGKWVKRTGSLESRSSLELTPGQEDKK